MATYCAYTDVQNKAGANASTTPDQTMIDTWIEQAEGLINTAAKFNFIDGFAGYDTDIKLILEMATAAVAAISLIAYDPSGYTSRYEAELIMDANWSQYEECIKRLKEKEFKDFITGE